MGFIDNIIGRNPHHVSHKLKGKKRLPGENYEKYRERLKEEERLLSNYRQGDLVWCSKALRKVRVGTDPLGSPLFVLVEDESRSKGTYVKKKHGHIESPRRA